MEKSLEVKLCRSRLRRDLLYLVDLLPKKNRDDVAKYREEPAPFHGKTQRTKKAWSFLYAILIEWRANI